MFITAIIMLSMMSFHAWIVASIIAGGTVSFQTVLKFSEIRNFEKKNSYSLSVIHRLIGQ